MAVTIDEIKQTYPLPIYNYRVDLGSDTIAFSEVSGLVIEYDVTTFKESPVEPGIAGPRTLHMPAQGTPTDITLKKGVVRRASINALYKWIATVATNQIEKKDIFVHLCDETGAPVITYKVTNAFPTKLEAPTFDASSNDAAVDTLQLRADGVFIEEA